MSRSRIRGILGRVVAMNPELALYYPRVVPNQCREGLPARVLLR